MRNEVRADIDWIRQEVFQLAEIGLPDPGLARALGDQAVELIQFYAPLVTEFTGLPPRKPQTPVRNWSRLEWLEEKFDLYLASAYPDGTATGRTGHMSRAQYKSYYHHKLALGIAEDASLRMAKYFDSSLDVVGDNLAMILGAPSFRGNIATDLHRLARHEVTHQVQDLGVFWFADEAKRPATKSDTRASFRAVVEGHGEFVDHNLPSSFPRTVDNKATPDVVGGIDIYNDGLRFVSSVVDEVGTEGFNAVWRSPDNLPTRTELRKPKKWIKRVL